MLNRWLVFVILLALPGKILSGEPVDYAREIKPLLKQRCFACHGVLQQKAKLRLDSGTLIHKGRRNGPAVKPAAVPGSLVIEPIPDPDESSRMPPEGKPLTDKQIALLRTWID